jgi:hypothetical protein
MASADDCFLGMPVRSTKKGIDIYVCIFGDRRETVPSNPVSRVVSQGPAVQLPRRCCITLSRRHNRNPVSPHRGEHIRQLQLP